VTKTSIFVRTSTASKGYLAGSLVLNNVKLTDVPVAVGVADGAVVLPGGTKTITWWGQGNIYTDINPVGTFVQGGIHAAHKPSVLLDDSGKIFGKTHPQYVDYSVTQFVSVRDHGAMGDGKTDDTAALREIFRKVCVRLSILPLKQD
jgi:glucan 1,3-beta-glucosidase